MSQYTLEVRHLTKQIRKKKIVDDVSFHVNKGEIFGLLGPNGAGKTTIIRMIVQLINRSDGNVIVSGFNVDQSFKEAMSEIGAIVENPEFYKYMSGMKNLKHYVRMATKTITHERIMEVVKLVGLENSINDKVKTYSLGMRQRLGVAQALLHRPSLLILDEPTNGLDPQGIREFREYLRLLASQGISVLVSSHLLAEMELMCDRFAIIEEGKLIHISTMQQSTDVTNQNEKEVSFEVSNLEKAMEVMKAFNTNVRIEANRLFVHASREVVAEMIKSFVHEEIDIFEVATIKATLEDRFLEITNKEKKEQIQ